MLARGGAVRVYAWIPAALLLACPTSEVDEPETPALGDDDDDWDDDDDDDEEECAPPEFEFDGLTFYLTLTVTPTGDDDDSGGDDDDSGGDDDDSGGDDDDSAGVGDPWADRLTGPIRADFVFVYWRDLQAGMELCQQHVEIEGVATFGEGVLTDCPTCTGWLEFDPGSAVDVSDRATDPDHSDPVELAWEEADWGTALLTSGPEALGDFLSLGLVSAADQQAQGLDLALAGGSTAEEIAADLEPYGLAYDQAVFVELVAGSLAEGARLDEVASPAAPGAPWYAFFTLFRDPDSNGHEGPGLAGFYGGQGLWPITFAY